MKQNLGDLAPRLLLVSWLGRNHLAYLAPEENLCPELFCMDAGSKSSFRAALSHAVSF